MLTATRSTRFAVAVLGVSLVLAACAADEDEATTDTPTNDTDVPAEEDDTDGIEEDDAAADEADDLEEDGDTAAPADMAEVEVGETLEDPDMGDTVEILSAVRDFPSEEQTELIDGGGEVVLVEVQVTPGDEFGGRISDGNFRISWDDGADFWNNDTRQIEEEMGDADYPALEDISRRDGGEHTGWIAFFVDERSDTYLLEYSRRAAEVIGSDEEIDEFAEEVEIPAP